MTQAAELIVNVVAKDEVSGILTRLDAQLVRTEQTSRRAGREVGESFNGGAQRAAGGFLALQRSQAALEAKTGQLEASANRLRAILATQTSETTQTIAARRQLAAVEAALAAQTDRTSRATLQEAQSLARLQQASGDTAGAIRTLTAAQGQLASGSAAFNQVGAQIARLQNSIKPGASLFQQFGAEAKSSLLGVVGPAAAASAALGGTIAVVNSFADAFKFKAQLDATTASINAQLKGVRSSSQVYAEAAAFAARFKLTQQETTEAIQASIGVMRQSKAPVEDIISVLARLQILSPEQSLTEAAFALKALAGGDTQSLVTRFEVSRDVATQMKQEIQGGADAVAVLSRFLDQSGIGMDALAAKTVGASGAMKDLAIAQEDLTLAQARFAEGPGLTILEGRIAVTRGLTRALSGDFEAGRQSIAAFANEGSIGFSLFDQILGGSIGKIAAYQNAANAAAAQQAALAAATDQSGTAILRSADADDRAAAATQNSTSALQASTEALNAEAAESALAAVKAEELSLAKQALIAQAQAAAQALLNAGAAGAATAARLAGSSNQVDVLTAAYYRLAAAQAAVGAAAVKEGRLERDTAGDRAEVAAIVAENERRQREGVLQHTARLEAQGEAYKKIRDAQEQQVLLTGTAAEKQAVLQKQLDRAATTYGRQSEAAIKAQTALIQFQQQQAKGDKGGGGAGGVKLSDQQKLNNALLTDQEKFNDKFEDAELDHAKRLFDIQKDFVAKMLKAQRDFQSTNLDSRASFYDSLAGIEDAGLQKSLADQYEQAFAEAQQIAQTRGADIADEFLKSKQQQLQAQAQRASEIAEAEKANDKDKAAYLKGVDALYRQAEEDRLKRVLEGEDSIAAERDRQLAEEGLRYEEAQGKIADSADASADRRIAAALRAGKAVDAERLQVEGLALSYDKLGRAQGTAGITPAAGPAVTTTTPVPAEGGDPIVAALNAAQAAIVAALASVERAAKDTASAVRQTRATGGIAG